MIYLIRDHEIAACETEHGAQAREAQGYTRCAYAAYRAAWQERDRVARLRIAREDEDEQELRELRRIVGKMPGVVYPRKVNEG
jgi:hypothetical protein